MAGNFRNKINNKKSTLKPKATTTSASSSSSSSTSLHNHERHFSDLIRVTQLLSSDTEDKDYDFNYDYGGGLALAAGWDSDLASVTDDRDEEFSHILPDQASYMVHIKNLPNDATVQEIRKIFANYNIRSLNTTGSSAYIEIESREEVIKLLKLDEPMCRGRRLFINIIDRFAGGDSSKTANDNKNNHIEPTKTIDTYQTADIPTPTPPQPPPLISTSISVPNPITTIPMTPVCNDDSNICNNKPPWIESQASPQSSLEMLSIDVKPSGSSSMEDLEKRMQLRLQKLCEFENAETLRREKMSFMNANDFPDDLEDEQNQEEGQAQEQTQEQVQEEAQEQGQKLQPQELITPMSWRDFCKQHGI